MSRSFAIVLACLCCTSPLYSQINKSKEFSGVYHSPAAEQTPTAFRSVLQLEVVVKKGEADPEIQYANGTVVSNDGLIASVLAEPQQAADLTVVEAAVLTLDGKSVAAEAISFDPAYGVCIFQAKGLDHPPVQLSQATLVAKRRIMWHAVFKEGRKTFLYRRPLSVHKASYQKGDAQDLCQIIDHGTSSLTSIRSGSALIAHDGSLVGLMGWHKHWNVTPKNQVPRTKTAWAVPAHVIARLLAEAKG